MSTAAARIDDAASTEREVPFLATSRGQVICIAVSAVCARPRPDVVHPLGDWFGWLTIVASIAVIAAMLL